MASSRGIIPRWQTAFFAVLALFTLSNLAGAQQVARSNIAFMFCDDLRYDGVGANGNKIIHTRHIDKLEAFHKKWAVYRKHAK